MLTLKKLLTPEVHDICPNCGEACTITDVLCPKCGKNLEELFERLPDSNVIPQSYWIAKTLMNPQLIKVWSLINSAILVASLFTPWIIFFSDATMVGGRLRYVFSFQILLSPIFALVSEQIFPLGEYLSNVGSSLLEAAAPAIAIYYSLQGIHTVFQMNAGKGSPTSKLLPTILRLLLAAISLTLIDYGVGFNSYVSLGYILAIVGFSSVFLLGLIAPVLGRQQINRKAA